MIVANVRAMVTGAYPGDLNGDGVINVLDILLLVNMILLNAEYNEIADLNADGIVNIQDIIMLVNIIIS